MNLKNPKIVVNYQGQDLESFSTDKENSKFPFQAHINNKEALTKLISIKLIDDDVEVGVMKLKMQSLMMVGANSKSFKDFDAVKEAMAQEKTNWFPIFKNKAIVG